MTHWFRLTDDEITALNPPHGDDVDIFEDETGQTWARWDIGEDWQPLGHAPVPRTRLGWFCHHLMHGLMMRYPLHKVFGWSFWYSFVEPLHEDEIIVICTDEVEL